MGHTCHSTSTEPHGKILIYIALQNPYFDPIPRPSLQVVHKGYKKKN